MTGVTNVIFIRPKDFERHPAWLDVAINPPDSVVAGRPVAPDILDQVRRIIDANRDILLEYWECRIDTNELGQRLEAV